MLTAFFSLLAPQPISAHLLAAFQAHPHLIQQDHRVEVSFFILSPRPSRDVNSGAEEEEEDDWLPDMDFGTTLVRVQEG